MGILDKVKQVTDVAVKTNEFTTNYKGQFDKVKKMSGDATQSLQKKVTDTKPQIIKQATTIDYDEVIAILKVVDTTDSIPEAVFLSITLLQKAADEYKQSSNPNKDEEFLQCIVNNIDAEMILKVLEPIASQIPTYGWAIVLILRLIIKLRAE
jgi:hypothetical protein